MTLRPKRSSLVTRRTSLGSRRSNNLRNAGRGSAVVLPDIVSVMFRRVWTLKPAVRK
jgi:hypothetical protein